MNYIKIKREPVDGDLPRIPYFKDDGEWYVNTRKVDGNDEWRCYTNSGALEMDLRQLLKKEYDARY